MPPESVVDALRTMVDAVRPGGLVLDLQVIRPQPRIEVAGVPVGEVDGTALFVRAEAATAAVEALIAAGELVEEAVDDHDVLKHYPDGPALVEDVASVSLKELFPGDEPRLRAITEPLAVRERCRLRRLRVGLAPARAR